MDARMLQNLITLWQPRLCRLSEAKANEVVTSRWTRKQVLGHLIDSAANNHQRFVRLQHGNLKAFPGYEQEQWVDAGQYDKNSWTNLVELWSQYNNQLVLVIDHIDPACGSNVWEEKSLTLQYIIDDYAGHMLHHLEQLVTPA